MSSTHRGRGPEDHSKEKWGKEDPKLGRALRVPALALIKEHPIGEKISSTTFDTWAEGQGLLPPAPPRDPESDAWIAHTKRRAQLLSRLNMSAAHSAMTEHGGTPFVIVVRPHGKFEMMAPHDWIAERAMVQRVRSRMHTKRRQLQHLMQATPRHQLQPVEWMLAETMYDDINLIGRMLDAHIDSLNKKFIRLQEKARKGIKDDRTDQRSPEIPPGNEPPALTDGAPPIDA